MLALLCIGKGGEINDVKKLSHQHNFSLLDLLFVTN